MLARPKAGGCWSGECEFTTTLTLDTTRVVLSPCGQQAGCCAHRGAYLLRLDQKDDGGGKKKHLQAVRLLGPKLNSRVRRLAFNPHPGEGRQIALASGKSLYILDISSDMRFSGADSEGSRPKGAGSSPVGTVKSMHSSSIRAIDGLSWSPHHPMLLASTCEDRQLNIWDLRQKHPAQTFYGHSEQTTNIAWSPFEGDYLATGYQEACSIWDRRRSGKYLSMVAAEQYQFLSVDWSYHDRHKLSTNIVYPGADLPVEVEWDRPPGKYGNRHLTVKSMREAVREGPTAYVRPYLKVVPAMYGTGAVKIWDTSSAPRCHQDLSVDRGLPGTAKFLPFGPSMLMSVQNCIALYPLDESTQDLAAATEAAAKEADPKGEMPSMPPAREVEFFYAHTAPVSTLDFARLDPNGDTFRILSYSHGDHCLRGWRYRVPNDLKPTIVSDFSPLCRELGSPYGPWAEAEGETLLGFLTTEAKELRQLPCVDEVTSYQSTKEKVEYQICVEVTSRKGHQSTVTIGVNPLAPETRRLLQEAIETKSLPDETGSTNSPVGTPLHGPRKAPGGDGERNSVAGLKTEVTWSGDYAGTKDGPLEPGTVAGLLANLQLSDIISRDRTGRLVEFFRELVRLLDMQEEEPSTAAERNVSKDMERPAEKPAKEKAKLPFPKTCGVCWSPKGHLLFYKSTKNLQPKKGWTASDLNTVMRKSRQKESRDLVENEEHGEHTRAAQKMVLDTRVQIIPTSVLSKYVEDHWWTAMAPKFMFEPTRLISGVAEVCWHNKDAAKRIGRPDLAEVWRIVGVVANLARLRPGGFEDRPFAGHLIRQILLQLFDAQETLTLAMLGCILSVFFDKDSDGAPPASTPETLAEAVITPPKPKKKLGWKPRPMSEIYAEYRQKVSQEQAASSSSAAAAVPKVSAAASSSSSSGANPAVPTISVSRGSAMTLPRTPTITRSRGPVTPKVTVTYPPPSGPSGFFGEGHPLAHLFAMRQPTPVQPVLHHAPPPRYSLWKALAETPALSQLIYSAHAHCELMHRLGQMNASRALAKLLYRLKAYHNLPIMDTGPCKFGAARMGPHEAPTFGSSSALQPPSQGDAGVDNRNLFGDTNTSGFGPPEYLLQSAPDLSISSYGGAMRGSLATIAEAGNYNWSAIDADVQRLTLTSHSSTLRVTTAPAPAPVPATAASSSSAAAAATAVFSGAALAPSSVGEEGPGRAGGGGAKKSTLACELCYLRIQTLATRCWKCGHPFHVKCFREWFDINKKCPAFDCKCNCVENLT